MRTFALATLVIGAALNGLLGYWGQGLAEAMRVRLQTYGATVPAITRMALDLPLLFYVAGVAALVCAGLGARRVITDKEMLYAAFACLFFDVVLLFVSHFAFTYAAIRM